MSTLSDSRGDGHGDEPVTLSKDDAFHLLQNARRRAVLRHLLEHDEMDQYAMRNIAERVAAWEHDTTVAELASDERQRVYIALYQNHLPKLDKHRIIEYNQPRGVVRSTPRIYLLARFLKDELRVDTDLSDPSTSDSSLGSVVESLLG